MRNYDEEIRKLNCDIERLSIEKNKKESQLKSILREQKENEKQSSKILKDQAGVPIKKETGPERLRLEDSTRVKVVGIQDLDL